MFERPNTRREEVSMEDVLKLAVLRQMLEQQGAVIKAQRERLTRGEVKNILTEEELARYQNQVYLFGGSTSK